MISNKDSLIELQKEQIKSLQEKVSEYEKKTTDALAESLSKRVEIQLSEIERLNKESESYNPNTAEDSMQIIVEAVAHEIKEWRDEINEKRFHKWSGSALKRKKVTGYLGSKSEKKLLYAKFIEKGGTQEQWTNILSTSVDDQLYDQTFGWTITQWREYVFSKIRE
ncbi:hypothetical protein GV054_08490 [Marinomonas mediterranea]|uniref:hypothetical protein n=1 Tax=Marinomonas mediterranea TaxID=119864 RepID=UPI00234A21D6|nr:hypothetical protein [Marinomonas mediterranea]WCN13040.1 hypothetical protein GV054_08490 [Marinomonas mediterranea]